MAPALALPAQESLLWVVLDGFLCPALFQRLDPLCLVLSGGFWEVVPFNVKAPFFLSQCDFYLFYTLPKG